VGNPRRDGEPIGGARLRRGRQVKVPPRVELVDLPLQAVLPTGVGSAGGWPDVTAPGQLD